MSKKEIAVELFNKGYACSQAVLATYSEELGLDYELALKVSTAFGGGMGRLGEVCGAVTGAYMLIGLKYGKVKEEDSQSKEMAYELVNKFSDKFIEMNGSINCRELIEVDLKSDDKNIIAEKVKTICTKAVKDAAVIIEELLELK